MRNFIRITPFIFFGLFVCLGSVKPAFGAGNGLSKDDLSAKYNSATGIKKKYQLNGVSLKRTVKNDPRDKIEVTIGGDTDEFEPKLKISRWDDEVYMAITPKDINIAAAENRILDFSNERIIVRTPDIDYQLYDIAPSVESPEEAFEYEADLRSKPDTNVVQFTLETKGLDFYYQPPLDQQMKIGEQGIARCTETRCFGKDGNIITERPENVVGSYAVYMSRPKRNYAGKTVYGTGKAGHIYRPKIIDSAGTSVWGTLNVDTMKGLMTITIPQDFLDKAVYPVMVDPTFGYATIGGSTWNDACAFATKFTPASAGTVTSVSLAVSQASGTTKYQLALYASGTLLSGTGEGTVSGTVSASWGTLDLTSPQAVSVQEYQLAQIYDNGGTTFRTYYDANGSSNQQGYVYRAYSSGFPTPVTWLFNYANQYSIYATYTTIKSINGLLRTSVKTGNGLAIGSVKSRSGLQ